MAVPPNSFALPSDLPNSSLPESTKMKIVNSTELSQMNVTPVSSHKNAMQSDARTDAPKKTILEDNGYQKIKEVGIGTYAKVITAYSVKEKSVVAIKIISKSSASSTFKRKFLYREIHVVRGLNHPNLIKYYRSIETTHRIYIVMEYAQNGSLLDMIRREHFFSERKARHVYNQLIDAIEYLHDRGVVHRDIKCENILFDENNVVKIIDFGFASNNKTDRKTFSETYCGSRAYCCPELLKQKPYQPHSADVWASGVVLYAMVYGKLPFDDSDIQKLLKQVESKMCFPDQPNVSPMCRQLIGAILAPYRKRATFAQIKKFDWMTATELNDK